MTHPSPHPGTPTPPPGPSRGLAAFLDWMRGTRARKAEAAATAGSYGRSAIPLSTGDRVRNYQAQNSWSGRLTPKQSRRAAHKHNRAAKRAQLAA